MNIYEKIKKYQSDLWVLGGLFLIFAFLCSIFLFHQGNILIDCFAQNAYIPMEMLKGKVLYKDISVSYGPLSYQINVLLMLIFGQSLNTVYFAGIANSLIILLLTYLISRAVTDKRISFTVTFLIMVICVFHFWITNYIFPYSSAMTYSLTAFLASLLCSINYLRESKPLHIMLASIFIAISVLIKLDFLFYIPVLIALVLFKPVPIKYLGLTIAASSIVPLISWLVIFIQGVTFSNLYETYLNIRKFSRSEIFRHFYSNTGMFFNSGLFDISINMLLKVIINLSIATAIIYLYFVVLQKIFRFFKIKLNDFILFLFTLPLFFIFLRHYYIDLYSNATFCWIPITATAVLIAALIFNISKIKPFEAFKNGFNLKLLIDKLKLISLKQRIFILVCTAAIISSLRCYFFVNLQIFGTFVLPLVLLVNIVFWVDYLPSFIGKYVKFLNIDTWQKSWTISLIILGIVFSLNYIFLVRNKTYPLETSKGTFYLNNYDVQAFKQIISYVQQHTNKNDSLLVIPRGLSINFFTGLSSNNKYYDFILPVIDVVGETKIIHDLKNDKPRLILVTNENSSDWGAPYICRDYAFNICNFIYENYQYKGIIGTKFQAKIFELKK